MIQICGVVSDEFPERVMEVPNPVVYLKLTGSIQTFHAGSLN